MKKDKQLLKIIHKLTESSFIDGRLIEKEVVKTIKILKSLPTSQSIFALSEYLKGLKRTEREHTMYIETSIPLSTSQVKRAKKIIEKKVKITKVLVSINPEILGGFKLKIGDETWDESVRGKIDQVKEAIRG
ncbi:F0F1 ATP synthase subunit delta [Candidatus Daviesbacteria bacterium]|nr:F0F1 ATP synthase subunit delta [Candidatus Daviesbacteria bacterium]